MAMEYITTRELEDKSGVLKGKVRILKLQEEPEALVEYVCPMCGFSEKGKIMWAEPFVSGTGANKKFLVKCGKCAFEIKFLKLKKEAAKQTKAKKGV
jgi:hypothetical protein